MATTTNMNMSIPALTNQVTVDIPAMGVNFQTIDGEFGLSGPTSNRPTTGLYVGRKYFDTTLNQLVIWNGTTWVTGEEALQNSVGILSNLTTTTQTDLVSAINENVSRISDIGVNVKKYGASGSAQTTTGTISAGSQTLTLTSAIDFKNGQGIAIAHAGAACTLPTPSAPTVTQTGATGSDTQQYQIVALDGLGGCSAASSPTVITTGYSSLSSTNYNTVSWNAVPGAVAYAVYGRHAANIALLAITANTSWNDTGVASINVPWIPYNPPSVSQSDALITTIVSGGGTTTLTLATAAGTSVTNASVQHDDTAAIQNAINNTPAGGQLIIPSGTYNITSQLVITNQIGIKGFWTKNETTNTKYGTILKTFAAVQVGLNSLVQINCHTPKLTGLCLLGGGSAYGSTAIQCLTSHGTVISNCYAEGFGVGLALDNASNHVMAEDSWFTGCNHGVEFRQGNAFDFAFYRCYLTGNATSSVHLVANTSTGSVAFHRCHMGFGPYGILQDYTTTGDGFTGLYLYDTPIELVTTQHILMYNGGNIRIDGGYWDWAAQPANPMFQINAVNIGPIWFSPYLIPQYPNPNCPYVFYIPGYTNYPIYVDTPLNGAAQKWFNYGGQLNMKYLFWYGLPFMGAQQTATNVTLTGTTSQTIATSFPVYNMNFMVQVYANVSTTNNLSISLTYNKRGGSGAQTVPLLPTTQLAPGEYNYRTFIAIDYHGPVSVSAQTDTPNSTSISVALIPC